MTHRDSSTVPLQRSLVFPINKQKRETCTIGEASSHAGRFLSLADSGLVVLRLWSEGSFRPSAFVRGTFIRITSLYAETDKVNTSERVANENALAQLINRGSA